jgi:hypothetical protein
MTTVKAERPLDANWHEPVCAFLQQSLPAGAVVPGLLVPLVGSSMCQCLVARDDAGQIVGVELWLSAPSPVHNSGRIIKRLHSAGNTDGFAAYRRGVFDGLPGGVAVEL